MKAELRHDPLTGEWNVVARARAERPRDDARAACPFCPGHEAETPPALWELPGESGWRLRAFPNRFPILSREGRHEVLVESPEHAWTPLGSTGAELRDVLVGYRARFQALAPEAAWLCAFHNQGAEAGGSLAHPHSQVVAARFVPPAVEQRRAGLERRLESGAAAGDQASAAEADGRLLWTEPGLAAIVPGAGLAGEVRIVPAGAPHRFLELEELDLAAVARLLRMGLCAHAALFGRPAYSWTLAEPPLLEPPLEGFELRVVPRVDTPAGFELASGLHVLDLAPEDLAPRLRGAAGAWRPGEDSNP